MLRRTWSAIMAMAALSGVIGLIDLFFSLLEWVSAYRVSGGIVSTTVVGAGFLAMSFLMVLLMEVFGDREKTLPPQGPPYIPPPLPR